MRRRRSRYASSPNLRGSNAISEAGRRISEAMRARLRESDAMFSAELERKLGHRASGTEPTS